MIREFFNNWFVFIALMALTVFGMMLVHAEKLATMKGCQ